MTRSTWGFNTNDLRRTYIPTVLAQFLCYLSKCFEISGGQGKGGKEDRTLAPSPRGENHPRVISNKGWSSSRHWAFLRPANLQLDIFLHNALLRIVTSSTYKHITKCSKTSSRPNKPTATKNEIKQHFTCLNPMHLSSILQFHLFRVSFVSFLISGRVLSSCRVSPSGRVSISSHAII